MPINNPRDIPGLVVWYSAEAETSYADGAPMTQWTDLSGSGNHAVPVGATPQWQATTGPGGGPAVHFVGSGSGTGSTQGYFQLPTGLMGAATAGEVHFQVRRDPAATNGNIGQLHAFSNPDFSFYTYSDAKVYDAFGSTARKDAIVPTVTTDAWRRLNMWSAPNDWAMRLDGAVQRTASTNTVAWYSTPTIGTSANASGIASGGQRSPFKGWVSTVVLFNRKLTTTERSDLDAWLAAHPSGGTTAAAPPSATLLANLRPKSAAFAAATVLAASLTGSLPAKTASFALDIPAAPDRTVSLLATLARKTSAGTILGAVDATFGATLQRRTASIALDAPASLALAGTLRAKTASVQLETEKLVALTATLRRRTASVTLSIPPTMALVATLRRRLAGIDIATVPTVLLAGQLQQKVATYTVRAITPVTPAPPPVVEAKSVVVAQAFGPVTMNGTQPAYSVSQAEIARGRQQIVVDGVDVTYFRGAVTPDVTYTLLEPLLYGPGQLDLPQIAAYLGDTPGAGDLVWLRPQVPVEVNLVVDDVVVDQLYKGFVAAFDLAGPALSVELGGEANGRAAMRDRQVPIFPRINDVGHQLADAVRDLGLPHYPPLGAVTGIETMTTGGTGHLDHINNLVAKSWTRSGKQWTVMPDPATGVYETHRKDTDTIHATAFLGPRTVARLRRDIAEEPNQIFVTCVTPAGMRVRFGKYPGLVQGPVPDFPGNMFLGDTGEGVRLLVGKLHASGYLRLTEVAGGYDDDVMRAVMQLQDDAGLPETGEVNLATWRALYDLDVTGLSLEWANIQPAAQRSKTRKFNRSANGTILGFNDEYDPDVIVRHRTIDLGAGGTRKQAREYAKTVLHDSDSPNWVGDIVFNTGALLAGEHAIGATVTAADVLDARLLRPGMNIWLPAFDGGTLVHVSACQVDGAGVVTATVDTRFRDAMEVWEVIARNRESRNDPSRHRLRAFRASTIAKDSIGEWDEFGGFLGVDIQLERGWTVFPVIAAMEGQIRDLHIKLKNPGEFAVAVFGQDPDRGWLEQINPHPLTVTGTRVWEKKADEFKKRLILFSAGTHEEPGGYFPGRKKWKSVTGEEVNPDYAPGADDNDTGTDDAETIEVTTQESFGTVTGEFYDEAGFPYFAADRKVVYVALWVRSANVIEAGRIMKPQLEAGA